MNKRLYIYICSIILCLISACSFESKKEASYTILSPNSNDNVIVIDLDEIEKGDFCLASSLFKNVVSIILETNDNSLIVAVDKVQEHNDKLYILDREGAKGILIFDKEGKYLDRIGRVGQGPGEYRQPYDFTIDTDNNVLYILDIALRKVYSYNLIDRKFIKTINLKDESTYSHYIQYVDGKLYANADNYAETDNDFLLREIDIDSGEQVSCWLDNKSYNKGFHNRISRNHVSAPSNPFHPSTSSGVNFNFMYMDTIMSINKEGVTPLLTIKSKDIISSEDIQAVMKKENRTKLITDLDKIHTIEDIVDGRQFILFQYTQKRTVNTVIYDKEKQLATNHKGILDDLVFAINLDKHIVGISPQMKAADKNGVYSIVYDYYMPKLLDLIQKDALNLPAEDIEKLKKLTPDSNPVLFYYEYK